LHPENGITFNRSAFFQKAQAPRTPPTSWRDVDDRMHLPKVAFGIRFTVRPKPDLIKNCCLVA
jgi:hypothetical protein